MDICLNGMTMISHIPHRPVISFPSEHWAPSKQMPAPELTELILASGLKLKLCLTTEILQSSKTALSRISKALYHLWASFITIWATAEIKLKRSNTVNVGGMVLYST